MVYGIAGAEYENDAVDLSKTAGYYFEQNDDGSMRFRAHINELYCKMPSLVSPLYNNPEKSLQLVEEPKEGVLDVTLWNSGPPLEEEEIQIPDCNGSEFLE